MNLSRKRNNRIYLKGAIYMTIRPMYKTCIKCKQIYSWNPSVGNMWCPYCGPVGIFGKRVDAEKGKKDNVFRRRK